MNPVGLIVIVYDGSYYAYVTSGGSIDEIKQQEKFEQLLYNENYQYYKRDYSIKVFLAK